MKVGLTGSMRTAAGGVEEVEIQAENIGSLLRNLVERYPRLSTHIDEGVAVSIDGQIYRDDWQQKIDPEASVFLMPRVPGG